MKRNGTQPRSRLPILGAGIAAAGLAVLALAVGVGSRSQAPGLAAAPDAVPTAPAVTPEPAIVEATPPAAARAARPAPARAEAVAENDTATPSPSTAPTIPGASRAEAGMRVWLDPETGEIGAPPPGELLPEQAGEIDDSFEGLVQEVLPDGSVMMHLQGRFQQYSVVSLGPDGRRIVRCGPDPGALHVNCAHAAKPEEK